MYVMKHVAASWVVNCFRILHSSAGLFIVFIIYCVVDVRCLNEKDEHTNTCLEKDVIRHEFVGHLRENLGLQGEILRFARLFKGKWKSQRRTGWTHHLPMRSLVVSENGLDLLSNHEYWLFPSDAGIFAMLIIDISEGDVGRVVLD
jgi:hypothetical protein